MRTEPIFVPRPDGTLKDDGVVISHTLEATGPAEVANSYLLVLNATDLSILARVHSPGHMHDPFSVHSIFATPSSA